MSKEKNTYFVYPMLQKLEETTDREERARLKTLIAVNIGRPEALREIFGLDSESLTAFYPDEGVKHLSTDDTIDSFLARFGDKTVVGSGSEESDVMEDLLPETVVSTDYFSTLSEAGEELPPVQDREAGEDVTASLLDSFLSRQDRPESVEIPENEEAYTRDSDTEPQNQSVTSETNTLTEGFARILIKNGNYTKAIEIIRELNLKNPEKSVYFADQIRFLRKLMVNETRKNSTSTQNGGK